MAETFNKKKRILQYVDRPNNADADEPGAKQPRLYQNNFTNAKSLSDESDEDEPQHVGFGMGGSGMGGIGMGGIGMGGSDMSDNNSVIESGSSSFAPKSFVVSQGGTSRNKGQYSSKAANLMAKMGYVEGKGLGKNEQGRVDIVESSLQKGRRGLGVALQGFEMTSEDWDFERDEVAIREKVEWISPCTRPVPDLDEMKQWMQLGKKKMSLDDEDHFCDTHVLHEVLKCKSVFDNLEDEEMRKARTRSNPYETIRGVFFLNRAAMKMANMDALLDFMFTSPKTRDNRPAVGHNELLYFADICAGPGGFSEYVLWRKECEAKGFGFTLKGPCDFKLEEFYAAPSELFEPYYGVGGPEGDGDIYRPDNLLSFQQFVMESTDGKGVHFVMADGGFSVEGQENLQEILSKRLYLCQFLCALMIMRNGGHFVCKLFDVFTPFSVGLLYLMYRAFHEVTLIKPVTSRPANSERYIVCKWKREDAQPIQDYMFAINQQLDKFSSVTCDDDVTEVVPLDLMKDDEQFFNYVYQSNIEMGKNTAVALVKIQTFAKNPNLHEQRQTDTREACLKAWGVPDKLREHPNRNEKPINILKDLTGSEDTEYLQDEVKLEPNNLTEMIKSAYDYRCFLRADDLRYLLVSAGKRNIFKWDGKPGSNMRRIDDNLRLELPRKTILEVESVQELRGEGKGQRRVQGVHVIDAMFLYGQDLRKLHYMERIEKLKKFVRAINRPSIKDLTPIRVKEIHRCEDLEKLFSRLSVKKVKGSGPVPRLCYCSQENVDGKDIHFLPIGLCFLRTVKDPYMMAFSKSQGKKYYYNTLTRKARFETPQDAIPDFGLCQKNRLIWSWEQGVKLLPEQMGREDFNKLSKDVILDHIHSLLPHKATH